MSAFETITLTRRQWLKSAIITAGATTMLSAPSRRAQAAPSTSGGPFTLPALPYDKAALAPHMSSRTLEFHHDKHHQAYVDNTNKLLASSPVKANSLEEIVRLTAGKPEHTALFNNAAQAWNHAFFWRSLKPKGGGSPSGALGKKITTDFGSVENFAKEFTTAATGQFGSGWTWLISSDNKLQIITTSNADTPVAHGQKPLLCLDVWEHAYYLDYQNKRADYVKAFLDHMAAWDFAEQALSEPTKQ